MKQCIPRRSQVPDRHSGLSAISVPYVCILRVGLKKLDLVHQGFILVGTDMTLE
jgi:hypothetical protein